MAHISQLYIYPIKSLGGIALQQSNVTSRGLEFDRRWMLIDDRLQFLSQRKYPQMCLFDVALKVNGLQVTHKPSGESIMIPYLPQTTEEVNLQVWDDLCSGTYVCEEGDAWFTKHLEIKCRLVYMADSQTRQVDERYASPEHMTSFADGYPMLLVSEASLKDLNGRLSEKIDINRFRPNIVITDTGAYYEDILQHFSVDQVNFYGVKPCARCVMINVDPSTAITGPEPLKTLASYRKVNKKVMFGQNLIHNGTGVIKVGDEIFEHEVGEGLIFE
ncbi:MOSC domain-containing protein [Mucilaginibacter aquatilis]|uniref:MOSC domain-containing protein n=1 Tax=Mucilaginibacter aquatilis TaxID=1517760 RepID=A0A6I4IDV6_9SPHI|nr:MOSC N-terminal beta barrel domain-containing protein [Mucilaginibacter aquatilis]MVN91549.1 MOSC domain-containing protein [Mucilaginibacter aquatilis]